MTFKMTAPTRPIRALVLVAASLLGAAASAQTAMTLELSGRPSGAAASAQPAWTFEQVLKSTLQSHPALIGKHSAQTAARADQDGADWLRYPTLTAESPVQSSASLGLVRIEQPLWTGGRITAAIEAADRRLDAAGAAIEEEKLTLSLRVIAAYTEALRQKARQAFASSGVAEHEKLLAMIRRRVTQEVSTLTDQRLAESRLFQAENDLSSVNQALQNSLAQLSQLSGKLGAGVADSARPEPCRLTSLEAALSQALAYSPTLRRLVFEEEAAKTDIAAKRSAYMPQLVLRLEKDIGASSDSRAMLVFLAQPGAGLSAVSGVKAAIAKYEALRMVREATERDVQERITLDWNEWVAAQRRFENASQSGLMSTEVFESYARQYVIGRKSWNDVLNAVREVTQAQFALEDVRAQTLAAGLRLNAQTQMLKLTEGDMP